MFLAFSSFYPYTPFLITILYILERHWMALAVATMDAEIDSDDGKNYSSA